MFQVSPDYSRMAPTERLSPERRRNLKTMFLDEARSAELKEFSTILTNCQPCICSLSTTVPIRLRPRSSVLTSGSLSRIQASSSSTLARYRWRTSESWSLSLRASAGLERPMNLNKHSEQILLNLESSLYRGYYTVVRRYEFYFRVAKQYFTNERSEYVKYCFCHEKIKFKSSSRRVMSFLLYRQKDIDKIIEGNDRHYVIDKLRVRLWKINHSGPGCCFYEFYEWYIFQ